MKAPKCRSCGKEHWGLCDQDVDNANAQLAAMRKNGSGRRTDEAKAREPSGESARQAGVGSERSKPVRKSRGSEKSGDGSLGGMNRHTRPSIETLGQAMQPPRERKTGRPLDSEKGKTLAVLQPWKAAGMSRRTWYRRRSAAKVAPAKEKS